MSKPSDVESEIAAWTTELSRIFAPRENAEQTVPGLVGVGTPEIARLVARALEKESVGEEEVAMFLIAAATSENKSITDPDEGRKDRALALAASAWLYAPAPSFRPKNDPDALDGDFERLLERNPKKSGIQHGYNDVAIRHGWAHRHYRLALAGVAEPAYQARAGEEFRPQYCDVLLDAVSRYLREKQSPSSAAHAEVSRQGQARPRWKRIRQNIDRLPKPRILIPVILLAAIATPIIATAMQSQTPSEPGGNTAVEVDEPTVSVAEQSSGPVRDEIAMTARNSQVVLNSILDNPDYGDERNFVQIKVADDPETAFTDTIALEPGQVYTVRIYVHNGAAPSSTSSVATGTRLQVQAPGVVRGSTAITALLSADNASPTSVWDSVVAAAPSPDDVVALRYLSGSATLRLGDSGDSVSLGDELFLDGVLIGCRELDGELPPADECAGYVTFEFRVDQPNFTVETAARIAGSSSEYSSNLAVHPGDVVEVRIVYTNTGTTQQDNVSVRVVDLPEELRYVSESTVLANSKTGGAYKSVSNGVTTVGYNAGSYQPEGNFYFKVLLQVDDEAVVADDPRWLTLSPFVRVTTSGGYKEAGLTLTLLP